MRRARRSVVPLAILGLAIGIGLVTYLAPFEDNRVRVTDLSSGESHRASIDCNSLLRGGHDPNDHTADVAFDREPCAVEVRKGIVGASVVVAGAALVVLLRQRRHRPHDGDGAATAAPQIPRHEHAESAVHPETGG